MCELGKPTQIRWERDPEVHGTHHMRPVMCNGDCIQTPAGQRSPVIDTRTPEARYNEWAAGDPHD